MRANPIALIAAITMCFGGAALVATEAAARQHPPPAPATSASGQPRVSNGRLAAQSTGGNLDTAFRRLVAAQTEPAWIGYAVPVGNRSEGRSTCCSGDVWVSDGIMLSNGRIATCGLEPSSTTPRPPD